MPVQGWRVVSFQQVTVSTTPMGLVIPGGTAPDHVFLSVHTNGIRVRWDGNDPTPTSGHLLMASGGAVDMTRVGALIGYQNLVKFRMVREGNADAEVAYTLHS